VGENITRPQIRMNDGKEARTVTFPPDLSLHNCRGLSSDVKVTRLLKVESA